jgi:hypothetical protein
MLPPAAMTPKLLVNGIAARLGPPTEQDAGQKQNHHGRPDRPAVRLIFGLTPEVISQAAANGEDGKDLEEIGKGRRILKGISGIGIGVTAAVGAEHLDGHLRGHRPLRNGLLVTF